MLGDMENHQAMIIQKCVCILSPWIVCECSYWVQFQLRGRWRVSRYNRIFGERGTLCRRHPRGRCVWILHNFSGYRGSTLRMPWQYNQRYSCWWNGHGQFYLAENEALPLWPFHSFPFHYNSTSLSILAHWVDLTFISDDLYLCSTSLGNKECSSFSLIDKLFYQASPETKRLAKDTHID